MEKIKRKKTNIWPGYCFDEKAYRKYKKDCFKKIKLTREEFSALLLAITKRELQGNVMPTYEDVKIELTLQIDKWGVWEKGGQAECWAWGIGQWLQKYRWKNVSGPLRGLKKKLEKLYKTNKK